MKSSKALSNQKDIKKPLGRAYFIANPCEMQVGLIIFCFWKKVMAFVLQNTLLHHIA